MGKPKRVAKGNSPKNARIKINYAGEKPKVSFSYPSKQHQQNFSMFPIILICWFLFFGLMIWVGEMAISTQELTYSEQIVSCVLTNQINESEGVEEIISLAEFCEPHKDKWLQELMSLFFSLTMAFIWASLTYFPFKKFWTNLFPKYQAGMGGKKKLKKFMPSDIKHSEELGYYCELPLFKNVILDFTATKDFSKYLKEFEIEEHKFTYYKERKKKHKGKKPLTDKQKKKQRDIRKKDTINETLWYARFYFKERVNKGSLEVLFK